MKNYPLEFKADAVALYESRPEATIRSVAADLGINPETLRNWVRAAGRESSPGTPDAGTGPAAGPAGSGERGPAQEGPRAGGGTRDPAESGEVFRRGDALVNRFQCVADLQRRYGVKRLCSILGVTGSSAGAQIVAGPDMITGGDSYEGLRDGSSPGYFEDPSVLGYLPRGGFGFLRSDLLDTHTGTSGREGRSLRLAADTGHQRVYALEENTALVVEHVGSRNESMRVVGSQGLAVFDLRHARARDGASGWSMTGADYSYLTDGDRYDPRHWQVSPAAGKKPLHPREQAPVPGNDNVFYSLANGDGVPYSFLGTARALAKSAGQHEATASTFESEPRVTVTFSKDRRFTALTDDGTDADTLIGMSVSVDPA